MNTAHRQASRQKRKAIDIYTSNPVFKAVSNSVKSESEKEFKSQLLTTRIKLLSAVDGEDATELLAMLSVVIGTPCEAGFAQFGHTKPWVGQLHGALRTLLSMCMQGYRWQSDFAMALDRALEVAGEDRPELDNIIFTDAFVSANKLAGQILRHEVTAESIQ